MPKKSKKDDEKEKISTKHLDEVAEYIYNVFFKDSEIKEEMLSLFNKSTNLERIGELLMIAQIIETISAYSENLMPDITTNTGFDKFSNILTDLQENMNKVISKYKGIPPSIILSVLLITIKEYLESLTEVVYITDKIKQMIKSDTINNSIPSFRDFSNDYL